MPEGGFLAEKPRSPGGLVIVIAAHAAVITALALSKMEVPAFPGYGPIKVEHIPLKPDPEPIEPEPTLEKQPATPTVIDRVPPKVPLRRSDNPVILEPAPPVPIPYDNSPPGPLVQPQPTPMPRPAPPPPVPPVRAEAQIDARSQLQPPYPASEERAGNEGSVTVRVQIGTDGRVKGVSKVSATSDAFWRATERHALRNWRFRPATLDGKPVESTKTMTVHFQLTD